MQDLTETDQMTGVVNTRPYSDGANRVTLKFLVFASMGSYCIYTDVGKENVGHSIKTHPKFEFVGL